jgi:hypothetical protein
MNEPVTAPVESFTWITPSTAPSRSSHPARLVGPGVQREVAFGAQLAEMSVSSVKISGAFKMGAHTGSWAALRWPVIVTCVPAGPVAGISVSVGVVESALASAGKASISPAQTITIVARTTCLGDRMLLPRSSASEPDRFWLPVETVESAMHVANVGTTYAMQRTHRSVELGWWVGDELAAAW